MKYMTSNATIIQVYSGLLWLAIFTKAIVVIYTDGLGPG